MPFSLDMWTHGIEISSGTRKFYRASLCVCASRSVTTTHRRRKGGFIWWRKASSRSDCVDLTSGKKKGWWDGELLDINLNRSACVYTCASVCLFKLPRAPGARLLPVFRDIATARCPRAKNTNSAATTFVTPPSRRRLARRRAPSYTDRPPSRPQPAAPPTATAAPIIRRDEPMPPSAGALKKCR